MEQSSSLSFNHEPKGGAGLSVWPYSLAPIEELWAQTNADRGAQFPLQPFL